MKKKSKQEKEWRKEKRNVGGSIKTIKGNLYARIQYTDEVTGKRKEKLRRADNRTHARALIKKMRDEFESGGQTALNADKLSFSQVAELYEKTKLIPPVFQNGIKVTGTRSFQNQIYLLKPLKNYFGRKAVRNIKPSDLHAYKAERLNTPVVTRKKVKKSNPKRERRKFIYEKVNVERRRSVASVNRELSLLRQIFGFALSEDYILRNPFQRAKRIISTAAEVQRERVLSFDEETALLAACEAESRAHIKPIIITALDTAMRKGDLLKLRWRDVDLPKGVITVQATNTKTEKTRFIGMTERVKNELKGLWDISPMDKDILVFGIKSNFNRSWRSAKKEAGLLDTNLHFHDLRHTAVTRMVRAGIAASEVMKITGHTEMKTFLRYLNLTNDSVAASANLLDNFNSNQHISNTPTASASDTEFVN